MLSQERAFRFSFYTSLVISIGFFLYTLVGPTEPNLGLMVAAPIAVLAVGLGARALSAPPEDQR